VRKAVEILASTTQGREALLEIIEQYGGLSNPSSDNPIEQARLVAKRTVAVDIMRHLLTDPRDPFTIMFSERFIRLKAEQRAKDENNDD
jgi:hypothetical protein